MEPFLWENYLEVELLDQRVCAFLFLKDIAQLSFREFVSIFILLVMIQCFSIICLFLVINYFNIISDINEYSISISEN